MGHAHLKEARETKHHETQVKFQWALGCVCFLMAVFGSLLRESSHEGKSNSKKRQEDNNMKLNLCL